MVKEVSLKDLLQELAEQRDFDFRGYKKTTLERRFRRRMFQLNIGSYADYGQYIRKHPDEVNELLNTLLINVTEFFRDPPAWEILRHEILPPILKRVKPGHSLERRMCQRRGTVLDRDTPGRILRESHSGLRH